MPTTNPSTLHPNPSLAALPYNPALSLWLSVDPLSDKYPGVSPYVYCGNNPVVIKDPDGREIDEWDFNIVTGQLTHIGNRGGRTTDYYNFKDLFGNTIGNATLPGGLQPEYCWTSEMDESGFQSSFHFIGFCADYGNPTIFYRQTFAPSPIPTPSLGDNIISFANSLDRMVMGHYDNSGLEGHGDYWDRQFAGNAEPYVTNGALLLPPVSMTNNICTLTTGQDIYGNQADGVDYALSGIGILAHPVKFLDNAVGNGAKWADKFTSFMSFLKSTTKNEEKKSK